jgi:hypothetical protein
MVKRLCVAGVTVVLMMVMDFSVAKAVQPFKTTKHVVSLNPFNRHSILLRKNELKTEGYDPNDIVQVVKACKEGNFYIRNCALTVLTDQIGDQAIPVLKEALDDPELRVRMNAARLLRLMGDTSGLARMRKDYAAVVPDGDLSDPNLAGLSGPALEKARRQVSRRNGTAMYIARVLAEFEDHSGFELAAKMVLDKPEQWVYAMRIDAARVLVEIALDDPKVLKAEGRDPEPVLVAMAESEKDSRVLTRLAGDVYGCGLPNDMAIHILEKIAASPHISEKDRIEVASYVKGVRQPTAKEQSAGSQSGNDSNQPEPRVTPLK